MVKLQVPATRDPIIPRWNSPDAPRPSGAATSAAPQSRSLSCAPAALWMVLRTRARQEKAVARYLAARDVEHYLPLVERVSMVRGRKLVSRVPLFPGYVFLAGDLDDGYGAVSTKRVCQIVLVHDQARFMCEIAQIRSALERGAKLELHPFAAVGRRCRVRKGAFIGIEGVVTERRSPSRLILHVDILGRGAALEIDADLLEPCE